MKIRQLIVGGAVILSTLFCQPVLAEEVLQAESVGYVQCEEGYVNIRDSASIDGKIIGKIYNNGQVFVQDFVNDWMQIRSGNVQGFIKSDFVITESDAIAAITKQAAYNTAYVYPEVLIVRAKPCENSQEIDRLYAGQEVEVVDKVGDWAKICIALDSYGYVNEYYISYHTYYRTAESLEEQDNNVYEEQYNTPIEENYVEPEVTYEEEYIPEENQEDSQEQDAEYYYSQETYDNYVTNSDYNYEESSYDYSEDYSYEEEPQYKYEEPVYEEPEYDYEEPEYTEEPYYEEPSYEEDYNENITTSGSGDGSYLSEYAQQYIGNPYVWGGTSLETGADCSGFTLAVLGANGITVNGRTAADQAAGGTQISLDEAQAGDLIYYDNGNGIYHIAIYNGDGTVTHSSSSTSGVTVSDMNYSGNAAGAVRYW